MVKTKSNIDHIRDIIGKSEFENPATTELYEFLDAVEEEITDMGDEIKKLEEEVSEKESEIGDLEYKIDQLDDQEFGIEVFLGLDTLRYELRKGNLKIQSQLEHWINQVQKQNAVVPALKIG